MSARAIAASVGAALLLPAVGSAQSVPLEHPLSDYLRLLQISGRLEGPSFTVRPLSGSHALVPPASGPHPWAGRYDEWLAPAEDGPRASLEAAGLRLYQNSSFPTGQNDGAVWQGKGWTAAMDVGAFARWSALTLTLRPTLIYNQNADFELAPVGPSGMPVYAYPWREIDLPQRFGPDPFWTLDPGQSEIRVDAFGVSVAFGTSSLWWGPGIRNAIVMSNNAPGFPHGSIGTDGPRDIGIGELEVQWIWGDLDTSEWFDPAFDATDRFITGIVASYSPSFLSGLTVGATRVFYAWEPEGGVSAGDYFLVFQSVRKEAFATPLNPTGDDEHDQMLSIFARWAVPAGGFEAYAEWARNDHSWNLRDFMLQPEHSQAYTLGLQKAVDLSGNRLLALRGELTRLERSATLQTRASPTYYAHHIVVQGYTNRGQVIGAGAGPGGNAQHLGADLYAPWGRAGLHVQRNAWDNDAYYVWAEANEPNFPENHISLQVGTHGLVFVDDLELGAGLALTRDLNRYFYWRDLWNLNVSVSARWRPR